MKNTLEVKKDLSYILDSMLITPTIYKKYNLKLVKCGEYVQIYLYNNTKVKKNLKDDTDLKLKKVLPNTITDNKKLNQIDGNTIEKRNIIRSKLECQRIAKSNMNDWTIFVTLTFEDNITDISIANKRFRYFIDKIRRIKNDFKYLCIPEFQKRGAVHYHLLCNISYDDNTLLYVQEDNIKFKHIKYWKEGFNSIEVIKGDFKKIIGYISKYMTKDIDNRLFGFRRYFYSSNLTKPIASYIDLDNLNELEFYKKTIQDKQVVYQNEYINPYDNTNVAFLEFL